ncbi:MAG TPA: glycosyltransferase family 9 protein [Vicinamibacterales bacterium]|nr:glycosyltransferase family 9 protein [Vicinamibacterales bacterium]
MNIGFMRFVDYWLGVPLTIFATVMVRLWDQLRAQVNLSERQRVLFIELTEMGSAILADPAMRKVASHHDIYFVIFKRNVSSLGLLSTVPPGHVFTIREDSFWVLTMDTLRFLWWCRRQRISAVIDLELFSRFTATLSGLSGARLRIGFCLPRSEGLFRGGLFTHPVAYNARIHIARNFIALTEPLLDHVTYRDPLIRRVIADHEVELATVRPSEESQQRVKTLLGQKHPVVTQGYRMVLVNINAGDFLPQRKWPPGHFSRFILTVLEQHSDVLILMTGSPAERPAVEKVAGEVNSPRCVNIAGDIAFEDLPALYALSEMLLTNDSGPAHFASTVGLRTYTLFGPETPLLYGPLGNSVAIYAGLACSPCVHVGNHRDTPCTDNQCLKQISPDEVYQLMRQDLARAH